MLSLFIATTVRAKTIPQIQTGVLTSAGHQPLVILSNLLATSRPDPTAQGRKGWFLTGNSCALGCFTLGISGLMLTCFLSFSCCKHCFIPGCQKPTVPAAAKTEWGVNFDGMPDCLLIKRPSILYRSETQSKMDLSYPGLSVVKSGYSEAFSRNWQP